MWNYRYAPLRVATGSRCWFMKITLCAKTDSATPLRILGERSASTRGLPFKCQQYQKSTCRCFSVDSNNPRDEKQSKDVSFSKSTDQHFVEHWLEQLKSPPNMITAARLLSIPYLSHLIASEEYEMVLYGCFLAGASDVLDGFLARRFNMTTVLGSYLDPLADKALINVLAVSLCYVNILPASFVGIVVLRDVVLVVGTYLHVKSQTKTGEWVMDPGTTPLQVSATTISKLNTGFQFLTLSIALIQPVFGTDPQILDYACWITGGTTIASAFSYIGHSAFSESGNLSRGKGKR